MLEQPANLVGEAREHARRLTIERRRNVAGLQRDTAIGLDLDDVRRADAGVLAALLALEHEARTQRADAHERRALSLGARVARLELALDVARETLGLFARVDLALAEAARRQREIDARLAHGLVEIERRRRAIVIGNVERRAVREHAARARDRDLADAEQGAIELELREAPAV